jgi:hypothetical protein
LIDGAVATWFGLRPAAIVMAVPVLVGAVLLAFRSRHAAGTDEAGPDS